MLRGHSRYEDAIEFFNQAITAQPDSADAYAEKALCEYHLDKTREAKASIDRAISLDPEEAFPYAIKALILIELNRARDACAMAKKAISMEAENATFRRILGQCYFAMEKYDKAEHWIRRALAADPDDEVATNLLTALLRQQNRMDENQQHMDRLLERNPENAFTHFNAGYTALQSEQYEKAEEHFRESLRLDPNFDEARKGLLQSFRARSRSYRLFLRYCFFMQRLSGGAQWALIIGLIIAVRVGRSLLATIHPSLSIMLLAAWWIFIFWSFIAGGFSNLMVMADSSARYALKKWDIIEGITVGGFFLVGLLFAVCAMLFSVPIFLPIGLGFAAFTLPVSLCYDNDSKLGIGLFATVGVLTLIAGISIGVMNIFVPDGKVFAPVLVIMLLLCVLSTWLSEVKALRR